MADVTIVQPSGQIAGVHGAGGQGEAAGRASNPPPGSTVSGTITGRDNSGNYLLKTSQGTFALRSSTPLTYNSDVTIRIGQNLSGNTSARIVSVNGEPFADFAAPQAEETDTVSTALLNPAQEPSSGNTPAAANAVRGVILSAPAPAATQTAATNLTAGNAVILRIPQPLSAAQVEQTQTQVTDNSVSTSSIATAAQASVAPEQVAQSTQAPALLQPAVLPAARPLTPPAPGATTPLAVAQAAPVETELAASQTVTQAAQALPSYAQAAKAQVTNAPETAGEVLREDAATPQEQTSPQTSAQPATANTQTPSQGEVETTQSGAAEAAPANAQQSSAQETQQNAPAVAQKNSVPVTSLYGAYTKQSSAALPSQNAPTPPIPSNGGVTAQVLGTDENGNVQLATPQGTVLIKADVSQASSSLTPGLAVTLEIVDEAALAAQSQPASLNELAGSWQSLKDIAATQNPDDPANANNSALLARLPQLGGNFLSQSVAFIAALMEGNTRELLGDDTLESLRQSGRADLLEKFSSEAAEQSASFTAPQARQMPGWQSLFLPFVFQEILQQARIYVKRDKQKKDRDAKAAPETRFVVEVDLTETGPLQMDGLVRKQSQSLAFDLIIRSRQAFSQEDKSEILAIYNDAAELTGFKGGLSFQVTRDFPVKPLEEMGKDIRSITA